MQVTLTLPDARFVAGDIVRISNIANEKYIDVLIVRHNSEGVWHVTNGKPYLHTENACYAVHTMQGSYHDDIKCTPDLASGKYVVMESIRIEGGEKIGHNDEAKDYYLSLAYQKEAMRFEAKSYEEVKARALLSRLAQGEVMSASDDMGGVIYMCSHCVPNEEYEHDAGKHESDCPIMLARKMLEIRANK